MATPNQNSPDVLSDEILAEAKRECDEIIRQAQQESASLLAAATAEADKIRREKLDSAQAEAARRSELTLATIPVETGRLRSARIEAILENIREAARRQLLTHDFDGHETVVTLAAEAIRRMPGTDFVLKMSAADHAAFGDKLAVEIAQRCGTGILPVQLKNEKQTDRTGKMPGPLQISISADPAITDGGVMIQSADGFQVWDNRLLSRLDRLWPELRRQIAVHASLAGEQDSGTGVPPVSFSNTSFLRPQEHTGGTPVPLPKP